jgi:tripeptidyl-peptidase I
MDVSDPHSPNYGKHWTAEQVAKAFAPAQETIDAVVEWLTESGISKERVTLSKGLTWVRVDSTVGETEALLRTKYKVCYYERNKQTIAHRIQIYEHTETKQPHVACEVYSVPSYLSSHIDFVSPTIHFDTPVKMDPKRDVSKRDGKKTGPYSGAAAVPLPDAGIASASSQSATSLDTCYMFTTPECLRALYKMPNGTYDKSSYGIVEYTPEVLMLLSLATSSLTRE